MLLGSCLCKGIRFQISGTHSKVIVCPCSLCRKPDANPRKTLYMVPAGILDDNPKLTVGEHICGFKGALGGAR